MSVAKLDMLPHYTYEDYRLWEGDWELIDGIAYAMAPAPMVKHQNIATEIARLLANEIDEECEECYIAHEVDYKVSDDTVLRPDVVLVCDEIDKPYITKAPKIVVEVVSKSTAKIDEKVKFSIYEDEGVGYYVLVYPDELLAKVYKSNGERLVKAGDFREESYAFEVEGCVLEISFGKVFERFRR